MHCNNQTIVLNSTLLKRCALNVALLVGLMPLLANANPTGASIVSGQVSIDTTTTPHKTTITNSPNAIINWQNFSIAQNETTQFIQQSSQSAVLNRVVGQNPSQILGQLYSNGKVFLINPNGIVFGQGATVDVQGLIASSLNLSATKTSLMVITTILSRVQIMEASLTKVLSVQALMAISC